MFFQKQYHYHMPQVEIPPVSEVASFPTSTSTTTLQTTPRDSKALIDTAGLIFSTRKADSFESALEASVAQSKSAFVQIPFGRAPRFYYESKDKSFEYTQETLSTHKIASLLD